MRRAFLVSLLCCLGLVLAGGLGRAQNIGFQLNRYEPTTVGEWSFHVDHPWYSKMRFVAVGLTMNYAHRPLVLGRFDDSQQAFRPTRPIIEHQLIGHFEVAGSFLDRVLITTTLPVTLLERGEPYGGISPIAGQAVGDPRLGLFVRLFGQPYQSAISMSLGAYVWVPLRKFTDSLEPQSSDQEVRVAPRLVLGGLKRGVFWSFGTSFLYRPEARLGMFTSPGGTSAGSEIQFGLALGYASFLYRLAIVPEFTAASVVIGGQPFSRDYTSLEALVGLHYNIASQVQLSAGGGVGLLRQAGTPDGRALLRLAYAPMRSPPADRDHDGVPDKRDLCPLEPQGDHPDPDRPGCPQDDQDGDGVYDKEDRCVDIPQGEHPDPQRRGCPLPDRDGDGVFDRDDQCPEEPMGQNPDPRRPGCPLPDRDGDGVIDQDDQCPEEPMGLHPDPRRPGCPRRDRDQDGVFDDEDLCPDQPQGEVPDPARKGCPAGDRDRDQIPDPVDACPDQPGAPHPDPKKHGCPGLVKMEGGKIVILRPVFFATDEDVILEQSFPVLEAVADALRAQPHIKKIRVEGHTDDRGKKEHNMDLSERRARSVRRFLIERGIAPERIEAQGFGPTRPIQSNKTAKGRAANRRVDFVIIDPPYTGPAVDPSQIVSPDESDQKRGKRGRGKGGRGKKK
ncbi:MAG: OmpA family protein [Myxococcota bacterium]|nr:OmpA family protein [Myxococcota bacterium]